MIALVQFSFTLALVVIVSCKCGFWQDPSSDPGVFRVAVDMLHLFAWTYKTH